MSDFSSSHQTFENIFTELPITFYFLEEQRTIETFQTFRMNVLVIIM